MGWRQMSLLWQSFMIDSQWFHKFLWIWIRHATSGGAAAPPDFGRSEGAAGQRRGGAPHYYQPPRIFDPWCIPVTKVRCLYQCSKMQFITFQNFHIQTWFSQFLWFFSLKCWFKGQMISRIHLILPNAYKLMCFDRNINGNRDVKFLECDKWSLHWYKNLTL